MSSETHIEAHDAADPRLEKNNDPEYRAKGRKALRAAIGGFFVDMYDVYLPVIALAPAIAYFIPADASATEAATLTALIFAVSLVGRPIGSIVFGVLGDRVGRRKTTVWVAAGFTVCTGLIALLPGYADVGWWAAGALVLLRLIDGIFLGGEYTAANPLAMEYAPRDRRGLYGALLNVGYPAALGCMTLLTMGILEVLPSGDADAAYSVWGWRIPFAVGFVISAMVFVHYLRSVPESELWAKTAGVGNPLAALLRGRNLRNFAVAFVTSTGAWLILDATIGVFTGHFKKLGADPGTVNTTVLISAVAGVALFPLIGAAGQRFGRRHVIMTIALFNLVPGPIAFAFAIGNFTSSAAVIIGASIAIVAGLTVFAMITAYIMEMFPTEVRSSGYGIAYSLPSIIPAFYPYYMLWLGKGMNYDLTPLVILVAGGAFLLVGAYISKDLRHVHL
ncbi:MFS family permease [Thermocatellispora tengchongensis]|uniref:MFS family permease n=3 Tax=Thermocatellispora tengchongensis TaxID=1073253 RepID=A0A840P7G5_9ACTN|nr:MFS transporter [Thermocatellispora tengchongensis]MBB5137284.1 MFS family permease [Thermocatellispora tengchongensis]